MGFVFGPVPSRRLGRSLGVDLVPFKTCSYDCIYCQLGKTTDKTVERKEWVPLDEVTQELKEKIKKKPDYITLSGSGEPTLYSRTEELIEQIHEMTNIPVAVLTNGSLLWDPEVRQSLLGADLVVPSLDAGDESLFQAVNRPHESLGFEQMLEGLIAFRQEFEGQYWLEVFLLAAHTALDSEVSKIISCAAKIQPDRIQLNTATRPTAEDYAYKVGFERMMELAARFHPSAEVIADYRGIHSESEFEGGREDILEMLHRRPCTVEDIAEGISMHRNEVIKYIEELNQKRLLNSKITNGRIFFSAK
jgi:wyosine [tRNA(Phe)-imidazoG37] synthetase (radical SAM superfamily)